jgi:superfamily II DNA helicase RecQ
MALNSFKQEAPWLMEQLLLPLRLKHLSYLWQQLGWLASVEEATTSSPKLAYWLPTAKGWCVAQQNSRPLNSLQLPQALATLVPSPPQAHKQTQPITQPKVTFSSKAQQRLYQALQQCRAMLAQRNGVDPTHICSHKVLLAMVQAHPLSEPALAALEGVDATFIEQFAPAFLDTLIPLALCP